MAALATPEQLASRMKKTLDLSSAVLAVNHGSGLVRAITRQTLSFVSQETVVLKGNEQVLTLPQRPAVVDGSNPLTVVELGDYGGLDFTAIEGRDYTRLGNELTRGNSWWDSSTRFQGWPYSRLPSGVWAPRVRVIYSHGEVTVSDDVVSCVLDAATVLYDNPTVLRSMSIDDYTETKATEVLGANMVTGIHDKLVTTGRARQAFSIRMG